MEEGEEGEEGVLPSNLLPRGAGRCLTSLHFPQRPTEGALTNQLLHLRTFQS